MYTAREVTNVLGLSPARLRSYLKAGFVRPERSDDGELVFSFQDMVLLRKAEGLVAERVPSRRVCQALRQLQERVPAGRPLAGVSLRAEGRDVVVEDAEARWRIDDGQMLLDFARPRASAQRHEVTIAPLALARKNGAATKEERSRTPLPAELTAQQLYERGCAIEDRDADGAREAYKRAVALDPDHADAHVNLGRLLHEAGHPEAAQIHYRLALAARPDDSTAAFNLGVALEDLLRREEAIAAYEKAIENDPTNADAHYNLARLHEQTGRSEAAIRHLLVYRQLTKKR